MVLKPELPGNGSASTLGSKAFCVEMLYSTRIASVSLDLDGSVAGEHPADRRRASAQRDRGRYRSTAARP